METQRNGAGQQVGRRRRTPMNYGVWACEPLSYTIETEAQDSKSPHLTLFFKDDSGRDGLSTAINIKSRDRDSRLVFWVNNNFDHPVTKTLKTLKLGPHKIQDQSTLSLDFQRTQPRLVEWEDGLLLPHDIPGPMNDIIDALTPIVDNAIAQADTTVYLFGALYGEGTGIHDVHMNQGSLPQFDNAVGQDGCIIFHFAADDHFEAVFLAFASQRVPTDDQTGLAGPDSRPLSDYAQVVASAAQDGI